MATSTEKFIEKANIIHENKYEYSMIEYKGSKSKVKILCNTHGVFEQTPNSHIQKRGCPKCGEDKFKISRSFSKEDFIENAIKIHNKKYDYNKIIYLNNKIKINIICKNMENLNKHP